MISPLVEVKGLKKYFRTNRGLFQKKSSNIKAVDGLNFNIYEGETFGLVGESGCGKSTTGRVLLQLLRPTSGEILYKNENLANIKEKSLRKYRREMQMIFQDPFASLDPRLTVGDIIVEPLDIHKWGTKKEKNIE